VSRHDPLESWVALFERHGMAIRELRVPACPGTDRAASVIFIAGIGSTVITSGSP